MSEHLVRLAQAAYKVATLARKCWQYGLDWHPLADEKAYLSREPVASRSWRGIVPAVISRGELEVVLVRPYDRLDGSVNVLGSYTGVIRSLLFGSHCRDPPERRP
jgi:hypothetical protein